MNSALTLLAIVGMPGSGKSFAADFFRSKNIPVLRFGDQTDIGLQEKGLPLTEENEKTYRENIRKELGMAAMAIKIEPRIYEVAKQHTMIVLDGLYSWEEYVYLKDKFPQIKLLHIFAPSSIRHDRLSHRSIRPLTNAQAQSRDIAEIEHLHKGGPIAISDFCIINDSDVSTFTKRLGDFYSSLI